MKSDMCFPSTEEFLAWLFFSNVFLMAKLKAETRSSLCHGSVGISRHNFPMVTQRKGDCPAWSRDVRHNAMASSERGPVV
jgi:hypothetical protein